MERTFLGWHRPALTLLVDHLLSGVDARRSPIDLSHLLIVLPGRRAQRRLLELLALECDARGSTLMPPQIVTVGRLPEQLYTPKYPFASEVTQTLAWARAIEGTDAAVRELAALPRQAEGPQILEMAELFQSQHKQLAADALDFAAVAEHYRDQGAAGESRRWEAMRRVQRSYLDILDGLKLWDVQTARLVAVRQRECAIDRRLIVAGAVDMNRTLRNMLSQVGQQVAAVVFAPQEMEDRFDEFGCVRAAAWSDAPLDIPREITRYAANPVEQAREVASVIRCYAGRFRADEIVVGAPDEHLVPQIQRQLSQCGLTSRWGPGEPLGRSAPHRLLAAVAAYLRDENYASLAELARHPDVEAMLLQRETPESWLGAWDRYYNDHLPSKLDGTWLGDPNQQVVSQSHGLIIKCLEPLAEKSRPLAEWGSAIMEFLTSIYGWRTLDLSKADARGLLASLESIDEALASAHQIPASLTPSMTAFEAMDWVLRQTAGETISAPADSDAIELLGWLELPLDDARALVVTSMNEGFVPEAANADLFLPNTLRAKLGIEDNARRYARDAYAISNLMHSREELALIVAGVDAENRPLAPSRLLLAVSRDELPHRVKYFFDEAPRSASPRITQSPFSATSQTSGLAVPLPRRGIPPLDRLSVTRFKDYLACPYRFYLKHVLKLKDMHDRDEEMMPNVFGNVLHAILYRFGGGSAKDSTDAAEIRQALHDELDKCFLEVFGPGRLPAVGIQREQMRRRLDGFAERQAERARLGWRIQAVEANLTGDNALNWPVDGDDFFLTGQIDRLERNDDGRWAVLDYKSFEKAKAPEATHRKKGEWIDLQLPLYYLLAEKLAAIGEIQVGYIVLPKDANQGGFKIAEWTGEDLNDAHQTARGVIRKIRRKEFWPPAYPPPNFSEALAGICQDQVWNRILPDVARQEAVK